MSPWVAELPYTWLAPLPLSEVVPVSSAIASACPAPVAVAPRTVAATAAVANSFFISSGLSDTGSPIAEPY